MSDAPPMMFDYPNAQEMDADTDVKIDSLADAMFTTSSKSSSKTNINDGNFTTNALRDDDDDDDDDDGKIETEEEERKRLEEEKFAWALEASRDLSSVGTSAANETKKKASLSLKSSHHHQRVQPGVSKHSQHHHHATTGATRGTGTGTKVDQVIKSILRTNLDDENNKPLPPSTPAINVHEQAARTLRDRRSALRVVEMFMTLDKFDSETQLAASTAPVLTQSEYKDACEERSLIGKCGWPLCSNEIRHKYKSKASQKLFSDETYCCAQHRIQSEVFAESNLREKADEKKALPPRSDRHTNFSEATMNSLDIVERKLGEVNFKTSEERPSSMPPTLQAAAATTSTAAATTTMTTTTTTEKIAKKKSISQKLKWNKEIDDGGEGGKELKKEEAGIFYFDIHEEGMKTTNRSTSKFIPSIGGRFAEGQLSTVPLRPDSPMIIGTNDTEDGNDIEPDENAEEANDDTKMRSAGSSMIFEDAANNEGDEIERLANAQREMIKKTLLANPLYSPEDDENEDENDENESAKANRCIEGEETEDETEEVDDNDEEVDARESLRAEELSLFGKTWMVLDSWVTRSTFLLVENDRKGSIEHYPYRDSRSAQFATGASEEFAQSINRILGGGGGGSGGEGNARTSNKKLQCERDMALIVRTFDFGTTVSLPKWPTKRWDLVTALVLDLVCESFSFEEDYYEKFVANNNEKEMEEKSTPPNAQDGHKKSKMELGEEIRLLRELFLGKCRG